MRSGRGIRFAMPELKQLKTVTFAYVTKEDRILAAVNPGSLDAWSCWLTRRTVLVLLGNTGDMLRTTSPLAARISTGYWGEIFEFEREAALVSTSSDMTRTTIDVLKDSASSAELIQQITVQHRSGGFVVALVGTNSGAGASFDRSQMQRLIQMLETEVTKASWFDNQMSPPADGRPIEKPVSH
jgi:hypothetical protein